jgi:hypothetical protein
MAVSVELDVLDGEYAVTLLSPGAAIPDWVAGPGFVNVSICADKLSIVTRRDRVPAGLATDTGWTALELTGAFGLDQPGIVLAVVRPVSEAGHTVFVVSTYHRDYLLVRTAALDDVIRLLTDSGHRFAGARQESR